MNFEEKLVELVKQNDLLYNMNSPEYRNIELKGEKWREIGARLRVDGIKAKQRWKSLRDRFIREYHRSQKRAKNGENPRIVWKYYNSLLFLKNYMKERISLKFEDMEVTMDQMNDENYDTTIGDPVTFELEDVSMPPISKTPKPSISERNYSRASSETDQHKITKEILSDKIEEQLARLMAHIAKQPYSEMTPIRAFFNAMALQVEHANIPFPTWAALQQEIMQLVNNTISALNLE